MQEICTQREGRRLSIKKIHAGRKLKGKWLDWNISTFYHTVSYETWPRPVPSPVYSKGSGHKNCYWLPCTNRRSLTQISIRPFRYMYIQLLRSHVDLQVCNCAVHLIQVSIAATIVDLCLRARPERSSLFILLHRPIGMYTALNTLLSADDSQKRLVCGLMYSERMTQR